MVDQGTLVARTRDECIGIMGLWYVETKTNR